MSDSSSTPTAEELAEVIAEFEQYRERLVNETLETAKKAKLPQKTAMTQLEPQLNQIDSTLQQLREQRANLVGEN
jgi:predicted  nucleic acid-binding Zn-ribbon protein